MQLDASSDCDFPLVSMETNFNVISITQKLFALRKAKEKKKKTTLCAVCLIHT